jgi:hypothetical protein
MKKILVVEELRVPMRNIQASISGLAVRKGRWGGRGETGAHCENVMACNHGRDWHTKNGDDTGCE